MTVGRDDLKQLIDECVAMQEKSTLQIYNKIKQFHRDNCEVTHLICEEAFMEATLVAFSKAIVMKHLKAAEDKDPRSRSHLN